MMGAQQGMRQQYGGGYTGGFGGPAQAYGGSGYGNNRNFGGGLAGTYSNTPGVQTDIYGNQYGQNEPFDTGYGDQAGLNDGTKLSGKARAGFISKVYSVLSFLMIITLIVVLIICLSNDVLRFFVTNSWILLLTGIISMICVYALGCYPSVARSVPINYILLTIFAICQSISIGIICATSDPKTVLIAAALTCAVVVALTAYACYTDTDITMCGGLLCCLCLILIVASILAIFIQNRWLQLAISIFGALLFCVYLIYDTQLILGNKSRAFSVDDYIMAAMMLYIDIIQIFLYILSILGKSK